MEAALKGFPAANRGENRGTLGPPWAPWAQEMATWRAPLGPRDPHQFSEKKKKHVSNRNKYILQLVRFMKKKNEKINIKNK